jgi:hypothetical protein
VPPPHPVHGCSSSQQFAVIQLNKPSVIRLLKEVTHAVPRAAATSIQTEVCTVRRQRGNWDTMKEGKVEPPDPTGRITNSLTKSAHHLLSPLCHQGSSFSTTERHHRSHRPSPIESVNTISVKQERSTIPTTRGFTVPNDQYC